MNKKDLMICHLYASPLLQDRLFERYATCQLYVFKRPNHSLYIAYLSDDQTLTYIGEYTEDLIYRCINPNPLDKVPFPNKLLSFHFIIKGQSNSYIACKHNNSNELFMFKKLDDEFIMFDTIEIDPYHIQDFLESSIDLNKL